MIDPAGLATLLDTIVDPSTGRGLVASGRASPPRIGDDAVDIVVDVSGMDATTRDALEEKVRAVLADEAGTRTIRVVLTAERSSGPRLIAVASGKGGVGKSTVSTNLAVALHRMGIRVGLVDADIYGPSQPRLFGIDQQPEARDKRMIPTVSRFGVPMLSMGQLVAPGQAIAWRGPMIGNALGQLLDAHWEEIDVIVVDLPPGTGDVQLSMIQKHRPAGAIIVSTPQDLALIDAARAIDLFDKARVPMIGLVENMAGYTCPACGEVSDPFGMGGAEEEAAARGLPFLGRIPLSISVRRASDAGEPPAAGDGADAAPFRAVAARVLGWLNTSAAGRF